MLTQLRPPGIAHLRHCKSGWVKVACSGEPRGMDSHSFTLFPRHCGKSGVKDF
jgi:hypothetical protein